MNFVETWRLIDIKKKTKNARVIFSKLNNISLVLFSSELTRSFQAKMNIVFWPQPIFKAEKKTKELEFRAPSIEPLYFKNWCRIIKRRPFSLNESLSLDSLLPFSLYLSLSLFLSLSLSLSIFIFLDLSLFLSASPHHF